MAERAPREHWWSTENIVLQFLAIGGALITLGGVALLVVLAVQSGLLGPVARIVLAYALAVLLAGGAFFVHERLDERVRSTPTIVNAFHVTALFTAMTTTLFVVYHYHWWPAWVGSTLCVVLMAASLYVTRWWRMKFTGIGISIAGTVFMLLWHGSQMSLYLEPGGSSDPSWIWPATIPALLLLTATFGRGCQDSRKNAAVLLMIGAAAGRVLASGDSFATSMDFALNVLTAVLFVSVVLIDRVPTAADSEKLTAVWAPVVTLFVSSVPPWSFPDTANDPAAYYPWVLLIALIGLVIAGCAVERRTGPEQDLSPAAFVAPSMVKVGAASIPLSFFMIDFALSSPGLSGLPVALYHYERVVFLGLTLAAIVVLPRLRAGYAPWITWIATALIFTFTSGVAVFYGLVAPLLPTERMIEGLLLIIIVATALGTRSIFDGMPTWGRVLIALSGLHLSAIGVVSVATYIGNMMDQADLGFFVGHAAVSVLWIGLAAYALLGNHQLGDQASLSSGSLLAVAGVAKLILIDLSTITGIMRVVAFLVSGVTLLTIAALRARRDHSAGDSASDETLPSPSDPATKAPEGADGA